MNSPSPGSENLADQRTEELVEGGEAAPKRWEGVQTGLLFHSSLVALIQRLGLGVPTPTPIIKTSLGCRAFVRN